MYRSSQLNGIARDSLLGFRHGARLLSLDPCSSLAMILDTGAIVVCLFANSGRFCRLFLATLYA